MYPNRIGFAVFGDLEIECLEIFTDNGELNSFEFRIGGQYYSFTNLCRGLNRNYPTISRLLIALGREKFLTSVLEWNPADEATRDSFYYYLADVANQSFDWDDQPW